MPARLAIRREDANSVELQDPDEATRWSVFFFPDVKLDLSEAHRADLARALEYYSRAMFEEAFVANGEGPLANTKPRTSDATWSAMVDIEHLILDGASALRTVHRMMYQRGREVVMGHLLVPLRRGLFEARVICMDQTTGFRESLLLAAMHEPSPEAPFPAQSYYDDPRHDTICPQHSLSRTRQALRWLYGEAGLRALQPAEPISGGEVELRRLGCAIVPPSRFVFDTSTVDDPTQAMFNRCSFCGTDGNESFLVTCGEPRSGRLESTQLRRHAEETSRSIHVKNQVTDLELHVEDLAPVDGQPHVLVIAEGRGHQGRLRNSFRWFLDETGRPWNVCVTGTAAVPAEVRIIELDAAARSWRRLAGPPATTGRPWWKIF